MSDRASSGEAQHLAFEVDYVHKQLTAMRLLLQNRGLFTYPELLEAMSRLDAGSSEAGARVMAHAWVDPAFKAQLLADPKEACAGLGIAPDTMPWELQVLENTDSVHHVTVCTTCSRYASPLLGPQPAWYKSWGYRSRVIQEPRAVLAEFGLHLPASVDVRVVDTDQVHRAIVLPAGRAGSAHLDEAALAALVTRDSMVGVGRPLTPS